MAGFEVVVRPVVFPNIRPVPARSLPPADDPEKGFCVIRGNGGKQLSLTSSYSMSVSHSRPTEVERREDEVRVYQMDDSGRVNRNNFVDLRVANRITMEGGAGPTADDGSVPEGGPNSQAEFRYDYYQPVQEEANIEVRKRDIIRRSGEELSGVQG